MTMHQEMLADENIVPISGRQLVLPRAPIFLLHRRDQSDYDLGAFRPWAGYKNFGADEATNGLVHFQHVLSFAPSTAAGRTGVHAHMAHVHIVIPTSGRGVFSYDGVTTEATPGTVIVQHGGTVHDQFEYSYAAASAEENRLTPQTVEPAPAGAATKSFGFLELFVPRTIADVEIVAPKEVTEADERSAWDHPYHAAGARFSLQRAEDPGAAYRPVVGRADLEARDADTWEATAGLVATWIIRPASAPPAAGEPVSLAVPGEAGGVNVLYMIQGSARFRRVDGRDVLLEAGDALTHGAGLVGDPLDVSPDMRLLRLFVSARAEQLRERTPEEIARLEALGARIITRREVRPDGDTRPINFLSGGG